MDIRTLKLIHDNPVVTHYEVQKNEFSYSNEILNISNFDDVVNNPKYYTRIYYNEENKHTIYIRTKFINRGLSFTRGVKIRPAEINYDIGQITSGKKILFKYINLELMHEIKKNYNRLRKH